MGITSGLNPEEYDRSYSDRELVRRIVAYFRPHIGKVLLVAAMVSLISILATATPIIISRGIDTLAENPQLQNPAILLLDEATASIDPLTEAQVQDALATVLQNRTSIIIAHRLSTVRAADRSIVLRDGQIIEEGNHEALLAQNGHYAELHTTYFRHQLLEKRPW